MTIDQDICDKVLWSSGVEVVSGFAVFYEDLQKQQ